MRWDIFCKVIDNHGDIGVCWRLSAQLAARGERVRLWLDDASALVWMAPGGQPGVQVHAWQEGVAFPEPGDVVIEAFGCELPAAFVARMAARGSAAPQWLNLEYLTAESFAERAHGLPSPVMAGPGEGLVKRFYYPGFTSATGGLLREPGLPVGDMASPSEALRVSLFCYEPAALPALLEQLQSGPRPAQLQVTAGRATAAVRAIFQKENGPEPAPTGHSLLSISYLPHVSQPQFDALLRSCDLNFVRGEDSLVRALWAGKPFVWQIYPQHDDAHHAKLRAFLDWLEAPPSLRAFHEAWNGITATLPPLDLPAWAACAQAARARLLAQDDLVTQLLRFTASR